MAKHNSAKSVKAQVERLQKRAIKVRDLAARIIRKQGSPSNTIESGRVGVQQPDLGRAVAGEARDLERMIERVAAGKPELQQALKKQLAAAKQTAAAARAQVAAAREVAAAKQAMERAPVENLPTVAKTLERAIEKAADAAKAVEKASLDERRAVLAKIPDVRQRDITPLTTIVPPEEPPPAPPKTPEKPPEAAGGPRILLDYVVPPPHTLTTKEGKYCETFRWFNQAFLVYDPSIPADAKGSEHFPWFGLAGPSFRCYYPQSSDSDFEACMTSGSSGRWLKAWPQKSNYIKF